MDNLNQWLDRPVVNYLGQTPTKFPRAQLDASLNSVYNAYQEEQQRKNLLQENLNDVSAPFSDSMLFEESLHQSRPRIADITNDELLEDVLPPNFDDFED